jgi:hypothetical protein
MNLGLPSFTNSLGITRPRHRPFFTAPAITVLDIIMVPGGVGEGGGDDQSLTHHFTRAREEAHTNRGEGTTPKRTNFSRLGSPV